MEFDAEGVIGQLDGSNPAQLNDLGFGVVAMNHEGIVQQYNRFESELSGLSPEAVLGKHFFTAVAPCTNNFMVAHRYEESDALDETIDYTFTYKMKPTKVSLRLLKGTGDTMYLLVRPR